MKTNTNFRNSSILVVSYLYILLFVYAAVSKLIDFENFQVQLGQSPLLSSFANTIAWCVPITELVIVLLLLFSKSRLYGLYAAFTMMVMFSVYIFLILNYSTYIPCSCGGVLEEMTWNQHLIFNLIFVFLAMVGVILSTDYNKKQIFKKIVFLIFYAAIGSTTVVMLFQQSEKSMQYANTFIRSFPSHFAREVNQIDLGFNSYYFAGISQEYIYLGNYTAPLQILMIDILLHTKTSIKVAVNDKSLPFKTPQIRVEEPYFYVFEGAIPYIFQGEISDWNAQLKINAGYLFSQLVPIDASQNALRYLAPNSGENRIGTNNLVDTARVHISESLLQKQIDGIIDTDGTLMFNKTNKLLCYVHRYKNEFTVFNTDLKLTYRGKTIDTISKAKIKLKEIKSKSIKTFAEPPLVVNKASATFGDFVFIQSMLRGQFESEINWQNASIIDVYDLRNNRYVASFYVYHIGNAKMKSFHVEGNVLYALIGDKLVKYQLREDILSKFETN